MIRIRPAEASDAQAMSRVLVASITQLCSQDHGNRPEIVASWTANKTPAALLKLLADPDISVFVAELDGGIGAAGAISGSAVVLNYVSPEYRFMGVSRALLGRLEAELKARGVGTASLLSTSTARRFYRGAGWHDAGEPVAGHTVTGYPMRKFLDETPGA